MSRKLHCRPGKVFGQLVALEPRASDAKGNQCWLFRCSCGREFVDRVSNAVSHALRGPGTCAPCFLASKAAAGG